MGMKKLVNGSVVEIDNISLFEKAFEGMVLGKLAASTLNDKITVESEVINRCIEQYEIFFKTMPFPLNTIESNIKYAAIGTFIKKCMDTELDMWVDEALFICIDRKNNKALKIVGNTWGVVTVDCDRENNVDIDNFESEEGYTEYKWLIDKVLNNDSVNDFYKTFMNDFVEACNNNSMIMKWELINMLTFANIPDAIVLKPNRIIDLDNSKEYMLDIYYDGVRKSGDNEYVFGIGRDVEIKSKYVKTYNYEAWEKSTRADENGKDANKIRKSSLASMHNLFMTICAIKIAGNNKDYESYNGIVADGYLVYCINNRVFKCKAYKQSETKEFARGVEIYGYDRGIVYIRKSISIGNGVKKESIYSYGLKDETSRLCKIQFINQGDTNESGRAGNNNK